MEEPNKPLRRLKVDMVMLESAFEPGSPDTRSFFDTETGETSIMPSDLVSEDLETELADAGIEDLGGATPEDLEQALRDAGTPDWQIDDALLVLRIQEGFGSRYVEVPTNQGRDQYRVMEDFVETISDARVREVFETAIQGRGAFGRFREALHRYPDEDERWLAFGRRRLRAQALDWLEEQGIEPILDDTPVVPPRPPRPPVRSHLLAGALKLVRAARELPGVERIALIGSLTTDIPGPKDVDVLVTVADDMDLTPLATLGRKLSGHAQQINRGADVFLADPRGRYIGRTCHWKECGPGIRQSCDAQHCGRRHYLHDDLQVVTLDRGLVAAPPVELWPRIVTRVPVPDDVRRELIEPLQQEMDAQGEE